MCALRQLTDQIGDNGYIFVKAAEMRQLLEQVGPLSDWESFAASWSDLGRDTYMADGGRYRKRRHGVFNVSGDGIVRQPPQPHYQSRDYNTLNGGIERWFEPVTEAVGAGASMTSILTLCHALFDRLAPARTWHVEVHQFRIEARQRRGRPTDARGYAPRRRRLCAGAIDRPPQHRQRHDHRARSVRQSLGHFTLTDPFDAALVDDARVMHGVTPVERVDPSAPAFRDVLVVTFRRV